MRMVKSVVCTEFGGYETIQVIDFPLKDIDDNDVEVEVHYCGLNFADLYTRLGLFPKEEKPFVLGIECSGIIRAVGNNVTDFKFVIYIIHYENNFLKPDVNKHFAAVIQAAKFNFATVAMGKSISRPLIWQRPRNRIGDRVVCYNHHGGLHRSTVILPSTNCYLIPGAISLQVAAASFVAFLTAHCCLWEAGGLQPGHQVLVQSCAGAVGSAAAQLAASVPRVVTWGTTSDPAKVPPGLVHHVLTHDTYLQQVPPGSLDLVVDNQAHRTYESNIKLMRPFGRIVVIGANYMIKNSTLTVPTTGADPDKDVLSHLMMGSVSVGGLHLGLVAERAPQRLQNALKHVWKLLIAGHVTAHVDSVWPLDTHAVREAHALLQERRNQAKVLVQTQYAANCT